MGCVIKRKRKNQSSGKDLLFPEGSNLKLRVGSKRKKYKCTINTPKLLKYAN